MFVNNGIKIIPSQQTPQVEKVVGDISIYIEKHRIDLELFLAFVKGLENAAGLAANQCSLNGKSLMINAFALMDMVTKEWRLIIIPIITEYIGIRELKTEYCLTWVGEKVIAERNRAVRVNYYDMECNLHTDEFYKGFEGQIWQHEIDHLNGKIEKVEDRNYPDPKPVILGRNELCPCGSKEKYKKCCLLLT